MNNSNNQSNIFDITQDSNSELKSVIEGATLEGAVSETGPAMGLDSTTLGEKSLLADVQSEQPSAHISLGSPLQSRGRRVYVNRNLRLSAIDVIGFDMDYTLARYISLPLEKLAVQKTVEKLIDRGYPQTMVDLSYDRTRVIRGLVIDKKYGNIFKMDRHRHVGRVMHGFTALPKEERMSLYRKDSIRLSAHRYHLIDTLYAIPEAFLFQTMVQMGVLPGSSDAPGSSRFGRKPDFNRLFKDIRECIDEAHRDGSINDVVAANPDKYVVKDRELAATLHKFRSSGKRIFLMTNSNWSYTNSIMSYLLGGSSNGYGGWKGYFDIIVVAANKPRFFTSNEPFYELDGNGNRVNREVRSFLKGKVYQGGNIRDFERLARSGADRILYVGDHIYGDVLRAKKATAWRTAMIIQEMEEELETSDRIEMEIRTLARLEEERHRLDSEINYGLYTLKMLEREGNEERVGAGNGSVGAPAGPSGVAYDNSRHEISSLLMDADGDDNLLGEGAGRAVGGPGCYVYGIGTGEGDGSGGGGGGGNKGNGDGGENGKTEVKGAGGELVPCGGPGGIREHELVRRRCRRDLEHLKRRLKFTIREYEELADRIETAFNTYWGSLFKEGSEHSAFGGQVEEFACLYTSRVSNFLWYSPCQYFRTPSDLMPHEHK